MKKGDLIRHYRIVSDSTSADWLTMTTVEMVIRCLFDGVRRFAPCNIVVFDIPQPFLLISALA